MGLDSNLRSYGRKAFCPHFIIRWAKLPLSLSVKLPLPRNVARAFPPLATFAYITPAFNHIAVQCLSPNPASRLKKNGHRTVKIQCPHDTDAEAPRGASRVKTYGRVRRKNCAVPVVGIVWLTLPPAVVGVPPAACQFGVLRLSEACRT